MTREEAIHIIEKDIQIDVRSCTNEEVHTFITALNMAISALREQDVTDTNDGHKWISVEERLPRRFERVLVWDKEEDAVGEAEYNGEDFKWVEDENIAFATHWMPLPEPPNKEAQ